VTKLDPTRSALVYSTYLGGSGEENSFAGGRIAVDADGNAYITGYTNSFDFPTFNAVQPACSCDEGDAFVVKLNPTGSAFGYSTYLGGSNVEVGVPGSFGAIAVDRFGDVYVTGMTVSSNFPTTARAFQSTLRGIGHYGLGDSFITKISDNPLASDTVTLFVPVIVSSTGLNNSFFTSELMLTNRGNKDATLNFTYTSGFGGGSGVASDSLSAGQQRIIPDAIAYLRSIGMPIPESGNRAGSLAVRFSGLSVRSDAGATVRTTTAVNDGRVGLAYSGISAQGALTGTSYLCGLRQDAFHRSNVALQNIGSPEQGDVRLRLTVFSGGPTPPYSQVLPEQTLSPGTFKQFSGILNSNGLSLPSGYVRVELLDGKSPYYAYAVVNDQTSSDGSFVPPTPEFTPAEQNNLVLPAIVETGVLSSELVLTNFSTELKTLRFAYVADNIQSPDSTVNLVIQLKPGEQSFVPNFVQYLRDNQGSTVEEIGPIYAGALFATVEGGDSSGVFWGANTSAPSGAGRHGVFYAAIPQCATRSSSAWLYGVQQNSENRTNLALVNTGQIDDGADVFTIEIFDGQTGTKAGSIEGISLGAKRWIQFERILAQHTAGVEQGYARVTRTAGSNPFIAYAVVNDGEHPGERTGDGAFVTSTP
jgi:Beta-propeller repeat